MELQVGDLALEAANAGRQLGCQFAFAEQPRKVRLGSAPETTVSHSIRFPSGSSTLGSAIESPADILFETDGYAPYAAVT